MIQWIKLKNVLVGLGLKYSEGTTLVGANASYPVNTTGGNANVSNISINHTHTYDKTTSGTYNTVISHRHKSPLTWYSSGGVNYVGTTNDFGYFSENRTLFAATTSLHGGSTIYNATGYYTSSTGSNSGAVNLGYSSTSTGSMNQNATIDAQNPYTSVYMYK